MNLAPNETVYVVTRTAVFEDWIKHPHKIVNVRGVNDPSLVFQEVIIGDSENGVYREQDYPK